MLGGHEITAKTRAHAKELLAAAAGARAASLTASGRALRGAVATPIAAGRRRPRRAL